MRATVACLMMLGAVIGAGCGPDRFDQPIPVMLDRDRAPAHRLAAAGQLGSIDTAPDAERYRRALAQLAWSDREPIELRRLAFDRLIAHDRDAFVREADRHITRIESPPALEHVFDRVAREGWDEFVSVAVRSYARRIAAYEEHGRPERSLIAALRPKQPVERTVYELLIDAEDRHALAQRVAAWRVLHRLYDRETLSEQLEAAPVSSTLVRDLRAADELLSVLPATAEQVTWLMRVRAMDEGAWWDAAAERIAEMSEAQRAGLALRHLPLLREAEADVLALERAELASRIDARLQPRQRVTRTRHVPTEQWTEAFDDQRDRLPWGDLLAIDAMQRTLVSPAVKRALFEQADADRLDDTSEHGGAFVCAGVRAGDRWRPERFAPGLRVHARRYVASTDLIEQMHTALAHYHFHAQRHDNADYAGPGPGDLAFAERFGCHALVFTFIDRDTLNADYYQPGGIVVDLGNVHRPGADGE